MARWHRGGGCEEGLRVEGPGVADAAEAAVVPRRCCCQESWKGNEERLHVAIISRCTRRPPGGLRRQQSARAAPLVVRQKKVEGRMDNKSLWYRCASRTGASKIVNSGVAMSNNEQHRVKGVPLLP